MSLTTLSCTDLIEFIGADEKAKGAMERVFVDGPVPLRRSAHSAVVVGNAMYVYGGWAGRDDSTLNDFWAFHFGAFG